MYQDARISLFECGCKQIELGGTIYLLDDSVAVSRGSSCLVYYAWQTDTEGLSRRVLLKEFYPLTEGCAGWRQDDSSLLLPDGLKSRMDRFLNSYERCKELFNEDILNQYIVQVQSCPKVNGTAYMVVDYSSGITMDKYMFTCSLFDFFKTVRNLSGVLGALHRSRNQNGKGYVHMDIKPGNILVLSINPEHLETRELCRLLDTDSFIHKESIHSERDLSGTPGYTAPEVMAFSEDSDNFLLKEDFRETGERADMYSLGAVIYEFIFEGELPEAPYEICHSYEDRLEAYLQKKSRYIPYKAISLIRYLLKRTLAKDPYDRYESMSEIEAEIGNILKLIDDKKVQILDNCHRNPDKILGREQKILELRQKLTDPTLQGGPGRVVIITGIGGIGKSSLAREYATIYADDYDIRAEVTASSAKEVILRIQIVNDPTNGIQDHSELVKKRKETLVNLCKEYRTLLIVHDYNVLSDPDIKFWFELGCDIVLTNRCDWSVDVFPVIELECNHLSAEVAKEIFSQFYIQNAIRKQDVLWELQLLTYLDVGKQELDKILMLLANHPLGIKLMARHMAAAKKNEIPPRRALEMIVEEGFPEYSNVGFQNINIERLDFGNIYNHISIIFRSVLKSQEMSLQHREALRYMTLVPACGIGRERYNRYTCGDSKCLEALCQLGWVEYDPHKSDPLGNSDVVGVFQMPLMIQEFLRKEPTMECTTRNCGGFLQLLSVSVSEFQPLSRKQELCEQQRILIQSLWDEETLEFAEFLRFSEYNLHDLYGGKYVGEKIIRYAEKRRSIYQQYSCTKELCQCDHALSLYYYEMGDIKHSQYYSRQAAEHEKSHSSDFWEEAVRHRIQQGVLLWERGHWEEAIHITSENFSECCTNLGKNHVLSMNIKYNIAYFSLRAALFENSKKLLYEIIQTCNATESMTENAELADLYVHSFYRMGQLLSEQGQYDDAIRFFQQTDTLCTEFFGTEHLLHAEIWNNMAIAFGECGNVEQGLSYRTRAVNQYLRNEGQEFHAAKCLLDLAIDYLCIASYEENGEELNNRGQILLNESMKLYNNIQNDIVINSLSDILTLLKNRAFAAMEDDLVDEGLKILEDYALLCHRLNGELGDPAETYRQLAQIFISQEWEDRGKYYLQKANSI